MGTMSDARAQRFTDRVVVVTGGASGIGRATAMRFAAEGAKVVIGDVADATPTVQQIADAGGEARYQPTDVSRSADVEALIAAAVTAYGGLDAIFNNAGIGMARPIEEVSEEDYDRLFAINVKGVFLGCKLALPELLHRGGGAIVNMSSSGGLLARASDPVYSASKHAVMGLTKGLAVTYAQRNVRINAVCPGPIITPLIYGKDLDDVSEEERRARHPALVATCPAGRAADPDEVASAVLFLASDEASFINGVGLAIDGAKAAGVMPIDRFRLDLPFLQA
jgi:NAD(P)-dependent dehydrogenase (short-subunit alcohol dehydrogenase family)